MQRRKNIMKKILAAAVAVVMSASVFAAGNYTKGVDITCTAEFSKSDFTVKFEGYDGTWEDHHKDILAKLRISTLDCFLFNDTVGVYAEMGLPFGGHRWYRFEEPGQDSYTKDKNVFQGGFEFMVGPAFGVNLGSSAIRLQ